MPRRVVLKGYEPAKGRATVTLSIRRATVEDAPVVMEFNRLLAAESEGKELDPAEEALLWEQTAKWRPILAEGVSQLPERQRQAIELQMEHGEDLKLQMVADATGKSVPTAHRDLKKALASLEEHLTKHGWGKEQLADTDKMWRGEQGGKSDV